jgi:hypothetical protein
MSESTTAICSVPAASLPLNWDDDKQVPIKADECSRTPKSADAIGMLTSR